LPSDPLGWDPTDAGVACVGTRRTE